MAGFIEQLQEHKVSDDGSMSLSELLEKEAKCLRVYPLDYAKNDSMFTDNNGEHYVLKTVKVLARVQDLGCIPPVLDPRPLAIKEEVPLSETPIQCIPPVLDPRPLAIKEEAPLSETPIQCIPPVLDPRPLAIKEEAPLSETPIQCIPPVLDPRPLAIKEEAPLSETPIQCIPPVLDPRPLAIKEEAPLSETPIQCIPPVLDPRPLAIKEEAPLSETPIQCIPPVLDPRTLAIKEEAPLSETPIQCIPPVLDPRPLAIKEEAPLSETPIQCIPPVLDPRPLAIKEEAPLSETPIQCIPPVLDPRPLAIKEEAPLSETPIQCIPPVLDPRPLAIKEEAPLSETPIQKATTPPTDSPFVFSKEDYENVVIPPEGVTKWCGGNEEADDKVIAEPVGVEKCEDWIKHNCRRSPEQYRHVPLVKLLRVNTNLKGLVVRVKGGWTKGDRYVILKSDSEANVPYAMLVSLDGDLQWNPIGKTGTRKRRCYTITCEDENVYAGVLLKKTVPTHAPSLTTPVTNSNLLTENNLTLNNPNNSNILTNPETPGTSAQSNLGAP